MSFENIRCPKGVDHFFSHYTTTKLVDIHEPRVKRSWLLMMTAVLFFCLYTTLRENRYCEVVPLLHTDYNEEFWWEVANWTQSYRTETNVSYCNGVDDTDFWFSEGWQYINNSCIWDFEPRHFSEKKSQGLVVSTSIGVFNKSNNIQTHALIVPHIEDFMFIYGMAVKIRDIETTPEVHLKNHRSGKYEEQKELVGGRVLFNVGEILDQQGLTMDSLNTAAEDKIDTDGPPELFMKHPSYRITGARIKLQIESSNFKFQDNYFDRTPKTYIDVNVETNSDQYTWACVGWKLMEYNLAEEYGGSGSDLFQGYSCDIWVTFVVTGEYCFLSWWAVLNSFIELTVLFSVASFVSDRIFSNCLRGFRLAKVVPDVVEWSVYERAKKMMANETWMERLKSKVEAGNFDDLTARTDAHELDRQRAAYRNKNRESENHLSDGLEISDFEAVSPYFLDSILEQMEIESPRKNPNRKWSDDQQSPPSSYFSSPEPGNTSIVITPAPRRRKRGEREVEMTPDLSRIYQQDPNKHVEVEITGLSSKQGKKLNGRRATIDGAQWKNSETNRWIINVDGEQVQVKKSNLKVVSKDKSDQRMQAGTSGNTSNDLPLS